MEAITNLDIIQIKNALYVICSIFGMCVVILFEILQTLLKWYKEWKSLQERD